MSEHPYPDPEQVPQRAPRRGPDPASARYLAAMHAMTPRWWCTPVLMAACWLWYLWMILHGVSPFVPEGGDVIQWGGNFGPRTVLGEWWRLVSCMFVHVGLLHIGFNTYVLWHIGKVTEKLLGQTGFMIVYFLTGAIGSLASLATHPTIASAGASGAVFGLFGALYGVTLARRRSAMPRSLNRGLMRWSGSFILLNIAIGFSIPFIDNSAHLGGLLSGLLFGMILAHPMTPEGRAGRKLRNLICLLVGGILIALAIWKMPELIHCYARLRG